VDGSQFDAWTRKVMTDVHGRRAALKTGLAVAAASLLGHGAIEEAAAAPRCRRGAVSCESECTGRKPCACIKEDSGRRTCVHPCCSQRACQTTDDCRDTEVCMRTRCCGNRAVCVTECSNARPEYCNVGAAASEAEAAGAPWGTTTAE
jgi:hypothetical protein